MTPIKCNRCDIALLNNLTPTQGDGNINANIMFIARNPTSIEFRFNVPLLGKSGELFQRYLDLFNFSRDDIYITNSVKCKTNGNRYPHDSEIYNCREYLEEEINLVNPKIIVLLGNTAIKSYFKLAYSNVAVTAEELNANYMVHNNRVILFTIHPAHALSSIKGVHSLFYGFIQLTNLYRFINPAHITNFNY